MSHFVLLVIGDDVDLQLAPFNEQPEKDDPHVTLEFEDRTDEFYKEYTTEEVKIIKRPDNSWDFIYAATDDDLASTNNVKTTAKFSELYPTFEEFCKEYHHIEPNEQGRYGYYANSNARWDWYVIGGRWSGFLKAKPGVVGKLGEKGVFGKEPTPGRYDQLQLGSIDFKGMCAEAEAKANERYDEYEAAVKGLEAPPRWKEFCASYENIEDARKAYRNHPYIKALGTTNLLPLFGDPFDVFGIGREKFVERARKGAFSPYAILKDGEWYSVGEMGMFGISSNDMNPDAWNERVWELLRDLPVDTLITVVDCHI